MNFDAYAEACRQGAVKDEAGDVDGALAVFARLAESGLPDLDRAVMYVNMATLQQKKGETDAALRSYDLGIGLEHEHNRFAVAEMKAAFLAQNGRRRESRELYARLARRADATLADRERCENNVRSLESCD